MTSCPMKFPLFLLLAICTATSWGQIVWTDPPFPTQDDQVTLYYDLAEGNAALVNEEPPCPPCPFVYAHTGVITSQSTSPSDWQYVQNPWPNGNNTSQANNGNVLLPFEGTVHSFDFDGLTLAEYYGVPEGVTIEQLAFVFRNADGSLVGKTADGGDIFYDISDGSFEVIFTSPVSVSSVEPLGSTYTVVAQATQEADLSLSLNGEEVAAVTGTGLTHELVLDVAGDYQLTVSATSDGLTSTDQAMLAVLPDAPPVVAPPSGVVDGINYVNDSTVILMWRAPYKDFVFAVGDFNGWTITSSSMMNASGDGQSFWIELTGLTPGEPYRYQYHILPDDQRYPDAYAEIILDQWSDPWIPSTTYPDMLPYPGIHTSGPVSVFTPGEAPFNWTDEGYVRPDQENLLIYELLVRDFTEARTFQAIEDTLDYLENLGVQAIELMPINEFNGNFQLPNRKTSLRLNTRPGRP